MHRTISFGLIALVALALGVNGVDLSAQRGRGQGQGRPAGAGKPAENPHKPTTSGGGQRPTASQQIAKNPHLAAKLQTLLPGANLESASAGFRNLGEFVAAAHVSHNLNIPFDQLKDRITGTNAVSLGRAIHELKPEANANAEAKKASLSADADMKGSN